METFQRQVVLTFVVDMCFAPEMREQAIRLLMSSIGRTEDRQGCRECLIGQNAMEEGRVRYSEAWESESSFRAHVRSEEFRRILLAMDLCREEPRVTIGSLTGQEGLAQLEALRDGISDGEGDR